MMRRAARRHPRLRLILATGALGFLALLIWAGVRLSEYDPAVAAAPDIPPTCEQAALTPHSEWTFMRHQNWLDSGVDPHTSSYEIVDLRTRRAYDWSIADDMTSTRFEVQTRWVWFHLWWVDDPWVLVYNC